MSIIDQRIPWKFVAEYIWKHGGTYAFGYTTCKKMWEKVRSTRRGSRFSVTGDTMAKMEVDDTNMA